MQRDIDARLQELRAASDSGLHLGCGGDLIPGLTNCDPYDERADLQVSATDLSAFADGSVDHIESHHMIEHLSFAEAALALDEMMRVLSPGGHVVITCPDMTGIARRWLHQDDDDRFERTIQMVYGSQEHAGMFHRSGYTAEWLSGQLEDRGFEVLFRYAPYPPRPTPSLLVIARRRGG